MKNYYELKQLKMLLVLLLLLGLCAVSIAQDADKAAEEEKVLSPVEQQMLKKISVDFRETPIEDVLISIAKQVDLNFVKSPEVTGNVTFTTATPVPLEQVLNNLLAVHNAGFVADEDMIRIVPASQLTEESEKMVSKVYRIVYADVKEVEKVLTKVISKRGTISANPGTSNIMITDVESKITAIDTFIEELDRQTAQILVEARIYDISNTDSLDLGIEWSGGRNTGYGTDYPTLDDNSGRIEGGPASGFSRSDPFFNNSFSSPIDKASATSMLRFGILNERMDIEALITAAQDQSAAKLLANPRILVLDNETASFKAIREIPYQRLQQGGYQSFGTTEFKEVGVELEVTPHLAKDGMIRLHILPVFSVQTGNIDIPLETQGTGPSGTIRTSPQPIVDRREADTIALVQDGDTVVIGGLRKEEITTQTSKVPLLGDIPVLGLLFRFEGEERIASELVVFITPRLIEEPVLTENEAGYLEATEFVGPRLPDTKIDPETKELK